MRHRVDIERVQRAVLFLVKSYQLQILQEPSLLPILKSIQSHMRVHFQEFKELVGVNQCGLKAVRAQVGAWKAAGGAESELNFERPAGGEQFNF
mmetsp:Transcript_11147/g.18708  ORF Transcript_11147/g.18708 Transcript_11147/m.18708 type:complete len:94 (-) Transcript_11147:11-292(-)